MMLAQSEQKVDLIQSFVAKKYRNTQSFSTKTSYENNIKRFYKFLEDDAKTIFLKIKENAETCGTLVTLRDNLLPKLMSGEIRV